VCTLPAAAPSPAVVWKPASTLIIRSTTHHHPPFNNTAVTNEKTHALSNAVREAKSPLGEATFHAFQDLARKEYYETTFGVCDKTKKSALPLSFAFQGSGQLLPFYQGVVDGLYERGVLTPKIARTAHFGGLSGGGLTSVLTALGFTGTEQLALSAEFAEAIETCLANNPREL